MIYSLIGFNNELKIRDVGVRRGSRNKSAWKVYLTSEKTKIKIHVGNNFKSRKRFLRVFTKRNDVYVYNDTLPLSKKLSKNNRYIKIKDELPLQAQIKRFMNYKSHSPIDISMSLKISKIINKIENFK